MQSFLAHACASCTSVNTFSCDYLCTVHSHHDHSLSPTTTCVKMLERTPVVVRYSTASLSVALELSTTLLRFAPRLLSPHLLLLCALAAPGSMTPLPHSSSHRSPSNPLSAALHRTCAYTAPDGPPSDTAPPCNLLHSTRAMHTLAAHCCIVCYLLHFVTATP